MSNEIGSVSFLFTFLSTLSFKMRAAMVGLAPARWGKWPRHRESNDSRKQQGSLRMLPVLVLELFEAPFHCSQSRAISLGGAPSWTFFPGGFEGRTISAAQYSQSAHSYTRSSPVGYLYIRVVTGPRPRSGITILYTVSKE